MTMSKTRDLAKKVVRKHSNNSNGYVCTAGIINESDDNMNQTSLALSCLVGNF